MASQDLAQATAAEAAKTDVGLRLGTVASSSSAGVMVSVSGGLVGPAATVSSYIPAVGDTVAIVRQDSSWLILGGSAPVPNGLTNIQGVGTGQVIGAGNTVVSNTTATFVKRSSSTRTLVRILGSGFVSGTAGFAFAFGINVGNLGDQDCGLYFFNTASDHRTFGGEKVFTGLTAGSYSFHAYGRTPGGANTVTIDANDRWSVTLTEY